MSARIKDIDRGWDGIKKRLSLSAASTKVGLPQSGEVTIVPDSDIEKMQDLVIVYAANEFGTKKIPPRPTLRTATDENRAEIVRIKEKIINNVLKGTWTVKQGMGILGEFLTSKVQRKIVDLRTPPNAPSTLKKKFPKTNPLIDKGQLVQSIQHVETVR